MNVKSNFRNKPSGFKYEKTDRDNSFIPLKTQDKIIDYMNAGVTAQQSKIGDNASISYQNQKTLDETKPEVEKFFNQLKGVEDGLKQILESTDPKVIDTRSVFLMGLEEDLAMDNKSGKLKVSSMRKANDSVQYELRKHGMLPGQELDGASKLRMELETETKPETLSKKTDNKVKSSLSNKLS